MTERPRILSGLIVRLDLGRLELPSSRGSIVPEAGSLWRWRIPESRTAELRDAGLRTLNV